MAKAKQESNASERTDLAKRGEDVLAALGEDFNFDDNGFGFDQRLQIPAIKFNDDDHPGQLYNKTTEEAADSIEAVFLYAQQYRDYSVSPDEGKTYNRLCSTPDARIGHGTIEESGQTRKCEGCPHAAWKTEDGKRVPPDCTEGFAVVGMDMSTEALFLARFQKTAYKPFQKLRAKYHGPQKIGSRRVKVLPLWMRRYKLTVEKVQGEKYYVPVIDPADPALIDPEQAVGVYEAAKMVEENMDTVLSFHRDEPAENGNGSGPNTDFNPADFTDGEGQDFTAEASAG